MKKILSLILAVIFVLSLSACDITINTPKESERKPSSAKKTEPTVTRERAIEIALSDAGVKESQVYDLDAELDYERGYAVWEVDFEYNNVEYSYDINPETEEILNSRTERD